MVIEKNKKKPASSNKKVPANTASKKNNKAANAKKKLSMSKGNNFVVIVFRHVFRFFTNSPFHKLRHHQQSLLHFDFIVIIIDSQISFKMTA